MSDFKEFENQDQAFAPANCTQIYNRARYDATFRDNVTETELMFEVVKAARTEELEDTRDLFVDDESFMVAIEGIKDGRPHSLLTREHFAEMIKF